MSCWWRRTSLRAWVAGAVVFLSAAFVPAADAVDGKPAAPASEQMDNPQYVVWKKFDVGASSTLTTTIDTGQQGRSMEMQTVQKLVEKTGDHVVIETSPSVKVLDQVRQLPAQRSTLEPKMEKKDFKRLPDEKVTAAGQTFTCKVYQMKQPSPRGNGDVEAKVWLNDAVPGGTVRMEATTGQTKISMLLQSFSAK